MHPILLLQNPNLTIYLPLLVIFTWSSYIFMILANVLLFHSKNSL